MPRSASHQLRVPQPCAESWAAMTPAQGGRHCAACQKVVVDFTQKTDAELLAYLAGAKATPCGRFRTDQLNRALHPAAPVSRWRAWLASALALGGVLGAGRAAAQSRSNYAGPLPEAVSPVAGATSVPAEPAKSVAPVASAIAAPSVPVLVRGVVVDAATGQPLPGVAVIVKGTVAGTSSNSEGQFDLAAPGATDSVRLSIHFIGYATQELTVTRGSQPLMVQLVVDARLVSTGIIIVGAPEWRPRPWPWHPRALYHWTRYRISRLLGH